MSSILRHRNVVRFLLLVFGTACVQYLPKTINYIASDRRSLYSSSYFSLFTESDYVSLHTVSKPLPNNTATPLLHKYKTSPHPERKEFVSRSKDRLTPPPPPPSCRRVCNNKYQNVILLTNVNKAGWTDRFYMILTMLQLSGYLCAQVWIPRPKFVLTPKHNQYQELSINVTWKELGDFQYLHHPQIKFANFDPSFNPFFINSWVSTTKFSPLVDWRNKQDINQLPHHSDVFEDPKFKGWLQMDTYNHSSIKSDFDHIERFTWNNSNINSQTGFVWRISANYYIWKRNLAQHIEARQSPKAKFPSWLSTDSSNANIGHSETKYSVDDTSSQSSILNHSQWKLMQPFLTIKLPLEAHLSVGCQYATLNPPTHIQELHDKMRNFAIKQERWTSTNPLIRTNVSASQLDQRSSISYLMGYFHIRRSDAKNECDTSLERISQYLNCSFDTLATAMLSSGTYNNQSLVVAVFLSSDESSIQYRQAVARLIKYQTHRLRDVTKGNIRVISIDVDKLVIQLLDRDIRQRKAPEWLRNNYYVYNAIFFLSQNRTMIQFELEKRRFFTCPNCTNIAEQVLLRSQTS